MAGLKPPPATPMSTPETYSNPVSQFRQLGDPRKIADWSAYLKLGITADHIPELGRMAADRALYDSQTDFEYWAPVHAWHALAQLALPASISPLIEVLKRFSDDDDWWEWTCEDLTEAFGRVGPAAIPALATLLADTAQTDDARQNAAGAVTKIYQQYPETRSDCVAVLTDQLSKFAKNEPNLNALLVTPLAADFKAVESAAVIEQAFQSGRVNEDFIGNWDDVQVRLGLKAREDLPPRPFRNLITHPWKFVEPAPIGFAIGAKKTPKTKAVAKRKLQKQSRQKNRPKKK
jgi:hypothetical protein